MAEHLIETINRVSTAPADGAAFDEWLDATDGIDFLKENIQGDDFVFYATPGGTFIHSILVPAANVKPLTQKVVQGRPGRHHCAHGAR